MLSSCETERLSGELAGEEAHQSLNPAPAPLYPLPLARQPWFMVRRHCEGGYFTIWAAPPEHASAVAHPSAGEAPPLKKCHNRWGGGKERT